MNDEELMEMEIENLTQACDVLQNRIKELEQINEEHRKINGQLRDNWNRLREWLEKNIKEKPLLTTYFFECDGKQKSISGIELEELKKVLDKMNELESKDKE